MKAKAYLNGKFSPLDEVKISVLDRGFLYGDGVFESFRTYRGKPFLIDDHLKRLLHGLKILNIRASFSLNRLKIAVLRTLAANRFKEAYIKIIVTRGAAVGHGLDVSNAAGQPVLIVVAEELAPAPKRLYEAGWSAVISSIVKPNNPTSRIKSLCYADNVLAKAEARKNHADEAFLLDNNGHVIEGTTSNLFIVKHGEILTPPPDEPILPGITRQLVLRLAREAAMRTAERPILPKELYNCDECFVTSSGAGLVPITRIWNRRIGSGRCGPLTRRLIELYEGETQK